MKVIMKSNWTGLKCHHTATSISYVFPSPQNKGGYLWAGWGGGGGTIFFSMGYKC